MKTNWRVTRHVVLLVLLMLLILWLVGGRRLTWTTNLESRADAHRIFRHLTETELIRQWVDGVVEMEALNGNRRQVGARSRIVVQEQGRQYEVIDEVTEYDQDRLIAVRIDGPTREMTNTFIIESHAGWNRLRQRMEIRHKGLSRFMSLFVSGTIQQRLDADFATLEKMLSTPEASAP